jgi:hypothetical protein
MIEVTPEMSVIFGRVASLMLWSVEGWLLVPRGERVNVIVHLRTGQALNWHRRLCSLKAGVYPAVEDVFEGVLGIVRPQAGSNF